MSHRRIPMLVPGAAEKRQFSRQSVGNLAPASVGSSAGPAALTASLAAGPRTAVARPPLWVVPPVVTLAVMLWGIQGASYSRDESSTMSAVQRPFQGLLRMLNHLDVVHGPYYVIIWPVVRLLGPGELATRLPSAVAMAVAAGAIFGLGRRLVSARAGLAAGLLFAVLPEVNLYGQTTRPYAMATGLAATASYLLVRAIQDAADGDRRRMRGWLLGYGACLAGLGYIHMFGLLLAAAHVIPVARSWMRAPGGRNGRSLAASWLIVVVGAVAVVTPLIYAGLEQQRTSLTSLRNWSSIGLTNLIGPAPMAAAAGLIVLCAITVGAFAGWARLRADWPGDLIALSVPWLIVPAGILIAVSSLVTPIYVFRYILFCAPAAALLVGAALAALGWKAGTAALAVLAFLALPMLLQMRTAGGHGFDFRRADRIMAARIRPGDVLVYSSFTVPIEMAYPFGMQQLTNVLVGETPNESGTLGGTRAPPQTVDERVNRARRMWLVDWASASYKTYRGPIPEIMQDPDFKRVRTWHTTGVWLTLYVRRSSG